MLQVNGLKMCLIVGQEKLYCEEVMKRSLICQRVARVRNEAVTQSKVLISSTLPEFTLTPVSR